MHYWNSTRKLRRTLLLMGALLSLTGLADCPPVETGGAVPSWEKDHEQRSESSY
jgi:hypothetical protein